MMVESESPRREGRGQRVERLNKEIFEVGSFEG